MMMPLLLCAALMATPSQPNILVIIADDLGWVDVSVEETPVLASLAATGTTFTSHHTYPNCSPTRAALWTGMPAQATGVGNIIPIDDNDALALSWSTVPERLGWRGYSCHLNGKWHLASYSMMQTHGPVQQGFETWVGVHEWFSTLPADPSWYDFDTVAEDATGPTYGHVTGQHITSWQVDAALAAIPALDEPWFYTLSLYAPHPPYLEDPPGETTDGTAEAIHDALVRHMDAEIGRLASGLGSELAGTVVIFMGDNGPPGWLYADSIGKGYLYERGTNTPLVFQGSEIPMGVVEDRLAQPEDVARTIIGLGRGTWPESQAFDLFGVTEREVSHVERFLPIGPGTPSKHAAAAWTGDHVMLRGYVGFGAAWVPTEELYDLATDYEQQSPIPWPYAGVDQGVLDALDAALTKS